MPSPPTPKWKVATLIQEDGKPLARLDAALWPSVGTPVHFDDGRPALIRSVHLSLSSPTALIVIDVESGPN